MVKTTQPLYALDIKAKLHVFCAQFYVLACFVMLCFSIVTVHMLMCGEHICRDVIL